jgi:quinoprotein glucose dehydrogenase
MLLALTLAVLSVPSVVSSLDGSQARVTSPSDDWPTYLGGADRTQFSPLQQITKANVSRLQVAWTYDTGDRAEYQSNNLIVDGVLYTASPTRKIIALNAATGHELWKWDPASVRPGPVGNRQRGLAYWRSQLATDARILTTAGNYLYALDPRTGALIRQFGTDGSVHLGTGTTGPTGGPQNITMNTPGVIYRDMYIVSGMTDLPGSVRAYDVRTGALRWIFHTIPKPGEPGSETWPTTGPGASGGANKWAGSALDEARGILYVPTESATPDFWGGDRKGANLFANSLIALDANTGRRLWHYQIVHHDSLDKDLPTPPVLLTVTHTGRRIDAVAQGTKHGRLFVFNRVTGAPLWPIEERPVPQTSLPGAWTSPTQPWPTKPAPLTRQIYTAADVSNVSPAANWLTSERYRRVGSHGPFPGPSLKDTIIFPGFDGGMEWGGAAADPQGVYYVNVNEVPWTYQMVATRREDGTPVSMGERAYMTQCATCHGLDRRGTPKEGMPSLVDIANRRTIEQVNELVDHGFGRMPSFEHVPLGQRRALVDALFGAEKAPLAYPLPAGRRGGDGGGGRVETEPAPFAFTGFQRWLDAERYPAIKPPWGTLNAVDLNSGEIKWKVTLGEYPELTARGVPQTGTENYGGPVVTATGLIFIGATADETIRAFDKDTGKVLWQAKLPFAGNATPSIYMVDGTQYVVISAGGGKSGRPAGGSLVAFALRR